MRKLLKEVAFAFHRITWASITFTAFVVQKATNGMQLSIALLDAASGALVAQAEKSILRLNLRKLEALPLRRAASASPTNTIIPNRR